MNVLDKSVYESIGKSVYENYNNKEQSVAMVTKANILVTKAKYDVTKANN